MTLQRLSCLVLAVVLGTALTVRWYLDAEEAVQATRTEGAGTLVYQHLPLPMRAEPARFQRFRSSIRTLHGVPCSETDSSLPAVAPLMRPSEASKTAPTVAGPSAFEAGRGAFSTGS